MSAKLCGIVLILSAALEPAAAQEPTPLAVEDALAQLAFAERVPIDVSPDGQSVAYTLADPRRREAAGQRRFSVFNRTGATTEAQGCDVWVTQIATGASKNLSGGQGTSWGPVWSPDSRALAFYSDRGGRARIWIWNAATDRLRPVGDAVVRPLFGFEVPQWTPDGKRLLAKILPEGQTLNSLANAAGGEREPATAHPPKDGVTAVVYRSPSTLGLAGPGSKPTLWMDASLADLALIDSETGTVNRITRGKRPRGYWISADGRRVAYTTVKGNESEQSQQMLYHLHVHTLEGASTRLVATGLRLDYGITVSWSPDGTRLAILTDGPKAQGDCLVALATGGEPLKLTASAHPSFAHPYRPPLWDDEGKSLYCIGAGGLWKITVADASFKQITQREGPPITDALAARHGRLWCPDAGKSAIVVTRDDATKRVGYERVDLQSGRRVQLLEEDKFYHSAVFDTRVARAGAAGEVVYLAEDARHGADLWSAAPDFRAPRRITRVNPQLDKLTFGPSRVVEWRGIDGDVLRGALVLPAGYRKDRRYPMVVRVYAGESMSNRLNWFGLSGTGVENLQLLATRGFAVLLDRVRTPLLLIQGAVDTVVPPSQSEELFVGLRRLGREVTYVRYEGEEHWPGAWSGANAADYLTRVVDWFERHLNASIPSRQVDDQNEHHHAKESGGLREHKPQSDQAHEYRQRDDRRENTQEGGDRVRGIRDTRESPLRPKQAQTKKRKCAKKQPCTVGQLG